MGYSRKLVNRAIKEALFSQVQENLPMDKVIEWLYEEFGLKVGRREWKNVKRTVLKSDEIKPQDMAILLIENNIQPNEGAWDVQPRRDLSRPKTSR